MNFMYTSIRIVMLLSFLIVAKAYAQQPLFKIIQNDKTGYINKNGYVVIQPQYELGSEFEKGRAVVKVGNRFGIIDSNGIFVKKPVFEVISEFNKGVSSVVLNGKRMIIDQKGEIIYEGNFGYAALFGNNLIIDHENDPNVHTTGVYDIHRKKFIVLPVYEFISDFYKGYAIAGRYIPNKNGEQELKNFLISTSGKVTPLDNRIPFFNVEVIEGGAIILANTNWGETLIIDYKGNILHNFKECKPDFERYGNKIYHEGLFRVYFKDKNGASFDGLANAKGAVVYKQEGVFSGISNFKCGRAWVYNDTLSTYLIDEKFEKVTSVSFSNYSDFKDNLALASDGKSWGVIDVNGNFLYKIFFEEIEVKMWTSGDCILYKEKEGDKLWGLADKKGQILLKQSISEYDEAGFVNGLLKVVIDNKNSYINDKGKIIWMDETYYPFDITPFNEMYLDNNITGSGLYRVNGTIDNKNIVNHSEDWLKVIPGQNFEQGKTIIFWDDSHTELINDKHLGYELYIANTTGADVSFPAISSSLYMFIEARDEKGTWRAIQEIRHPVDGFNILLLSPNEYWKVKVPKYTGSLETELRVSLTRYTQEDNNFATEILYSNTIKGSINPSQFYSKTGYPAYDWLNNKFLKKNH